MERSTKKIVVQRSEDQIIGEEKIITKEEMEEIEYYKKGLMIARLLLKGYK